MRKFLLLFFLNCIIFNPLFSNNFYYILQLDGGINFFNNNKEKIITKYNLDNLNKTIAPTLNIRTGMIWDDHWMTLLGYGYTVREEYDYKLNYFKLNHKALEQRNIHNLHIEGNYLFFPYRSNWNLSFGVDLGWALYSSIHDSIDNYSQVTSGVRARNRQIILKRNEFFVSPVMKIYRNLRKGFDLGGAIYLGIQYSMLFPSKINYPQILLGFDASLLFADKEDEQKRNTFINKKKKIKKPKKISTTDKKTPLNDIKKDENKIQ